MSNLAEKFEYPEQNLRADDVVTKKDLKIAFFEFAKEYKLEWMNVKLNFLIFLITVSMALSGFMFKTLVDILMNK